MPGGPCSEALQLNGSLGKNESFRSLLLMAYVGLEDLTAAGRFVREVGGSEFESVAVAASLTPGELPAGFNLTQFQESRTGIIYQNLDMQALALKHRVEASIEARFVDLTGTFATVANAVSVYSVEAGAREGFEFHFDPAAYRAWAVIGQPPGTNVIELQEAWTPEIVDQSVRYLGKTAFTSGLVMESEVIVFRHGNVVSFITVDSPAGLARLAQALELAQAQAQAERIKATQGLVGLASEKGAP